MLRPPSLVVQTSFHPAKSPVLSPTLRKRLLAEPVKKSSDEIQRRLDAASLRKRMILQATIEHTSSHNKRAREVAHQTKEHAAAVAAHKLAELSARLDAAAERRKSWRNVSPMASPLKSPAAAPERRKNWRTHPSPATSPSPGAAMVPALEEDAFALPEAASAAAEEAVVPTPLHEEITAQLAACGGEFPALAQWMKEPATIGLVAEYLSSLGIERTLAKKLLALAYMAYDAEAMFDDSDADKVMKREASRFKKMLARQLKRGTEQASNEPFEASFTRARRFYAAWSRQDIPKQARVVDEALQRLQDAMLRIRAQQVHNGTEAAPPEDILAQIRALAGEAAEQAARRQFAQPWELVRAEALEARVRETASRALFDSLKAQVESGDYTGLFGILGELQAAMTALVAHSPRAKEELDDHFDAKWIKQQASAGCLSVIQVHAMMRYLVERISGWQAPVDDGDTRSWAAGVERTLAGTDSMALPHFIATHLVDFLAGAVERVGKVYQRVMELSGQMDSLHERAAELDAEEAREGGMSAQD